MQGHVSYLKVSLWKESNMIGESNYSIVWYNVDIK